MCKIKMEGFALNDVEMKVSSYYDYETKTKVYEIEDTRPSVLSNNKDDVEVIRFSDKKLFHNYIRKQLTDWLNQEYF